MPSFGNSLQVLSAGAFGEKAKVYLRDGNFEALADGLKNFLIIITADERDGKTLGAETTCTTDTVKVRVGFGGHVVVDGEVDALNVDTATEDVSSNADALVELLKLLVTADTA